MVKTYQLSKLGEFGSSLKVTPVTTEKVQNLDSCLQVNGSSEHRIEPQSILPDLTGFKVWQHNFKQQSIVFTFRISISHYFHCG